MNASELKKKLIEEGCNRDNFCIGTCGAASDVYCLSESHGKWSIYYTERGTNKRPIYESRNEAEACARYYKEIMSVEHWHNVGFFESDKPALKLHEELEAIGIRVIRNDMLPLKAGGPKIRRLFVVGKDIFKVKAIYANLPLKNA